MLKFKTPKLRLEFKQLHPKLKAVLYTVAGWLDTHYHENLTVTCLFRKGDRGVHGYWRGADTRTSRPQEPHWTATIRFAKETFDYGSKGKHVVFDERFKKGRTPHLHWQVRDNTEMIND